jgi:hypothetical protein
MCIDIHGHANLRVGEVRIFTIGDRTRAVRFEKGHFGKFGQDLTPLERLAHQEVEYETWQARVSIS